MEAQVWDYCEGMTAGMPINTCEFQYTSGA